MLVENLAIYLLNYSVGSNKLYDTLRHVLLYFFPVVKEWEKINVNLMSV